MTHRYGYKADHHDYRDLMFTPSTTNISDLPRKVDLREDPNMPEVWNQGDLGACVWHGVPAAFLLCANKAGANDPMLSRLYGYYLTRKMEGTVSEDDGCEIRDAIKVAAGGLPPETDWAYDISKFDVEPPEIATKDALDNVAVQYESVPLTEGHVMAALAEGSIVVDGMPVYESMEGAEAAKTGLVPLPSTGEQFLGGHCLAPGTRVLTADLRWRDIAAIETGDELIGFDEHGSAAQHRAYRKSKVLSTRTYELPSYELEFEDGTQVQCSYDHMWLGHTSWIRTEDMQVGAGRPSSVRKLMHPWHTETKHSAGYLAAAFDGEGWLDGVHSGRIGFAQNPNPMYDHVQKLLAEYGFIVNDRGAMGTGFNGSASTCQRLDISSRHQVLRFLGSMRPPRLLSKFDADQLGSIDGGRVKLIRKEYIGKRTVVALHTTTSTFIAEGLTSHNCTAKVGYDLDLDPWDGKFPPGVWITRNSWGTEWGMDGYFYTPLLQVKLNSDAWRILKAS